MFAEEHAVSPFMDLLEFLYYKGKPLNFQRPFLSGSHVAELLFFPVCILKPGHFQGKDGVMRGHLEYICLVRSG